ncbi:MAG: polysaccharide deacetylase family protein, partial [Granulosicoccaceae bacterium]
MRDSGFIEFGGHTLSHPRLSQLSDTEMEKEIFEELDMLAPQLQRKGEPTDSPSTQTPAELKSGNLPDAIENIIEHHSKAMRREIAQLLENRLGLKP